MDGVVSGLGELCYLDFFQVVRVRRISRPSLNGLPIPLALDPGPVAPLPLSPVRLAIGLSTQPLPQ